MSTFYVGYALFSWDIDYGDFNVPFLVHSGSMLVIVVMDLIVLPLLMPVLEPLPEIIWKTAVDDWISGVLPFDF